MLKYVEKYRKKSYLFGFVLECPSTLTKSIIGLSVYFTRWIGLNLFGKILSNLFGFQSQWALTDWMSHIENSE